MSWIYLLKQKSKVCNVFVNFYKMIQTQFNTQIHILSSNNDGEYIELDMKYFIFTNGLIQKRSVG